MDTDEPRAAESQPNNRIMAGQNYRKMVAAKERKDHKEFPFFSLCSLRSFAAKILRQGNKDLGDFSSDKDGLASATVLTQAVSPRKRFLIRAHQCSSVVNYL
jgi:hypothetical protein